MGHTGSNACGDYVRRNTGATVAEARIPPPLGVGSVNHRDIKPSNLILQSGGVIRLIDFDAARIFKAGQFEDTKKVTRRLNNLDLGRPTPAVIFIHLVKLF